MQNINEDIIKDLKWRYTTKKFNPNKRVSKDDLNTIYESLRLSPSSINSQPWKFIVISSKEAKQKMADTFSGDTPASRHKTNKKHSFDSSEIILFSYNPNYKKDDFEKVVDKYILDKRVKPEDKDKAFSIFSFVKLNRDTDGMTENWCRRQLYIVLGNIFHTLARLKIDSTPMEGVNPILIEEIFKDDLDGFKCSLAIAIGYRDENDENAKAVKSRLDLKDIIKVI
jgi:nitroreductase/dihydropteridine reductase